MTHIKPIGGMNIEPGAVYRTDGVYIVCKDCKPQRSEVKGELVRMANGQIIRVCIHCFYSERFADKTPEELKVGVFKCPELIPTTETEFKGMCHFDKCIEDGKVRCYKCGEWFCSEHMYTQSMCASSNSQLNCCYSCI